MDNIIYASTLFWVVYVYVQNIKYILDRIAEEKKMNYLYYMQNCYYYY